MSPFLSYTAGLSKPITYAIALNELGNETVHKYVGTEPSGRMFNAIVLDYNGEWYRNQGEECNIVLSFCTFLSHVKPIEQTNVTYNHPMCCFM